MRAATIYYLLQSNLRLSHEQNYLRTSYWIFQDSNIDGLMKNISQGNMKP